MSDQPLPPNPNQPLIDKLLQQKEGADPDTARKIRQQLRKLGYSLREAQGGPPSKDPSAPRTPRSVKTVPSGSVVPNGKRFTASPEMKPEEIVKLKEYLDSQELTGRAMKDLGEDENGYGFDLHTGTPVHQYLKKYKERWKNLTPQWYTLLGEDNPGVKILLIGPTS